MQSSRLEGTRKGRQAYGEEETRWPSYLEVGSRLPIRFMYQ